MPRGKCGTAATRRHDAESATATITDYRHKVARLSAENRRLRERIAKTDREAQRTERVLRAERDEGLSPQIIALNLVIDARTTERDDAVSDYRKVRDRMRILVDRVVLHLTEEHGFTREGAVERTANWSGIDGVVSVGVVKGERFGVEGVSRIRAARGQR